MDPRTVTIRNSKGEFIAHIYRVTRVERTPVSYFLYRDNTLVAGFCDIDITHDFPVGVDPETKAESEDKTVAEAK